MFTPMSVQLPPGKQSGYLNSPLHARSGGPSQSLPGSELGAAPPVEVTRGVEHAGNGAPSYNVGFGINTY